MVISVMLPFLLPIAQTPPSVEIIRPVQVRPLPNQLDQVPVFNSNSPELLLGEGILLSTFPPQEKSFPSAHLNYAFQGRFDIFAHHIARGNFPDNLRTLYLGILLHNPSPNPVTVKILQGASYLSQPDAAFIDLPNDWQTNYAVNVIDFVSASEFKVSGVESALFHVNWYASHLNALDEPVLRDSLPAKVYRFTWLRSFHKPVVIRLENFNGAVTLYWKVSDGAGGYEPGKMIVNKSKVLTLKNWNDFVASVNSINFWNLPTTRSGIGSDGAQWILEGKELGKYHVVDRQSGGKIESVCLKLLELSNLKIKKDDIY